MSRSPGVLIVSASAGSGHVRAAEALREAFAQADMGRVEHVDILELSPAWLRRAYGGGFELVASRAPRVWRQLYARTDGPDPDRARWGPVAERLLFRRFRRLAASGEWSALVCTHFLPCQLAAHRPGFPAFSLVVTDFVVHRYWIQPGVRRYFVATDELAAEFRARTGSVVQATGIPVAAGFGQQRTLVPGTADWRAARAALGFDPAAPLVLVMGGGFGLGIESTVVAALEADVPGLQLMAICGRNDTARQQLLARRLPPERVRILGHVGDVPRLMAAADVVVSKPGGLTLSEALAVGRPLLLTRAVPGQEESNRSHLLRLGAALDASTPQALAAGLRSVFHDGQRLAGLTAAARAAGRPDAARDIATAVRRDLLRRRAA